jgi:hypothetical protein
LTAASATSPAWSSRSCASVSRSAAASCGASHTHSTRKHTHAHTRPPSLTPRFIPAAARASRRAGIGRPHDAELSSPHSPRVSSGGYPYLKPANAGYTARPFDGSPASAEPSDRDACELAPVSSNIADRKAMLKSLDRLLEPLPCLWERGCRKCIHRVQQMQLLLDSALRDVDPHSVHMLHAQLAAMHHRLEELQAAHDELRARAAREDDERTALMRQLKAAYEKNDELCRIIERLQVRVCGRARACVRVLARARARVRVHAQVSVCARV